MEDAEAQEREHFMRIVHTFRSYWGCMMKKIKEKESYIKSLPSRHQNLLESYRKHLQQQKTCIEHNAEILKLVVNDVDCMFENVQHNLDDEKHFREVLPADLDKLQTTVRQLVRDWSSLGEQERQLCYAPIINKIEMLFPQSEFHQSDVQVLVPGAGLGRLAYEIAKRGYSCQGNEFSLFMLFTSNFVLNKCKGVNCMKVFPWVHNGCNVVQSQDMLRHITFPDADPADIPPDAQFSMAAGDFTEVYTEKETWDCIASCFFIDCANNIVAFIERIFCILKPGGYWINLGPLLYHFFEIQGEHSIEPSYETVREIILKIGFDLLEEETNVRTTYTQNPYSMMRFEYNCVFFVAKKPI